MRPTTPFGFKHLNIFVLVQKKKPSRFCVFLDAGTYIKTRPLQIQTVDMSKIKDKGKRSTNLKIVYIFA